MYVPGALSAEPGTKQMFSYRLCDLTSTTPNCERKAPRIVPSLSRDVSLVCISAFFLPYVIVLRHLLSDDV